MKLFKVIAMITLMLCCAEVSATTCQYGGTWPNCNPKPPVTPPTTPTGNNTNTNTNTNTSTNNIDVFNQSWWSQHNTTNSSATGGNATSTANGGDGGSVNHSGNSSNHNSNTANGGSVGDTSSNSNSNARIGDTTLNNGSNSGGNTLHNGSSSGGNTMTGGANSSDSRASNDNSGNSNVSVDAADRSQHSSSYTDNTVFIPSVVPSTPSAALGVGNVTTLVSACGPLQKVVREQVVGTFVGLVKKSTIKQGYDETLAPYYDSTGYQVDYRRVPQLDGSVKLMGHQVITSMAIVGVAASRNVALGGGSGNDWGQVGGGSSSSIQQVVSRIQLRECEVGSMGPRPIIQEVAPKSQGG
jgi:hypothetical protein